MPHYAYLAADLCCPSCSAVVTDLVWFQWGFCPGRALYQEHLYRLGDPIQWKRCQDGSVRTWAYFYEGDRGAGANIGDPAFRNLITRDAAQFWWEDPAQRRRCEHCGQPIEGAAIEIRDGAIRRAWIYAPGELDNKVQDYILQADGSLTPMPAWEDHPMDVVKKC